MTATALPVANGVDIDPIAGIRREVQSLVKNGQLGAVLRELVNEAPGLSIGTAALLGYVLGAGVPPYLVTLAAKSAGRLAVAALLQRQLFTPRRNP